MPAKRGPGPQPPEERRVRESDADDLHLKTRAAWLYHMEGLTQEAVAERLGVSRLRVLKMLAASRQDGTVQVRVTSKLSHCVELERQLETKFKLDQAVVIPRATDEALITPLIGAATGAYVSDLMRDGLTIGLGWGQTLQASLRAVRPQALQGVTVVSMLGSLTRASGMNPSEFAWRFADLLGAECYLLAAPVFAPDEATRDALFRHEGIKEVVARANRLDVAIVSVGDFSAESTVFRYGLLTREEMDSLREAGAVGDVLCRFFDRDGVELDHPVNRRAVSIDPATLRRAPRLILASGGWRKVTGMRAALKLLHPTVVITDEGTAEILVRGE